MVAQAIKDQSPAPLWRMCWRCQQRHGPDIRCVGVPPQESVPGPQDAICRDLQCPCVAHRGLNEYLLSVYLPEWRAWRLTPTERRLVMALLPPGRLVTHDTLLQRVWGPEYAGEMRLLHVNLSRVRIAIHPHGWTITSVPAVGYLLERCEPGPAPKQRVMHRRPCPDCGGPMKAESNRCQVCVRRQQAERVARFRVCPDCGGEKSPHGRRCKPCHLRRVALGRLGRPVKVVAP